MDNFEKRVASLVAEHAELVNQNFPAEKTQRFWGKVSELPEEYQAKIRKLADATRNLKRNFESRAR